MKVGNIVPLIAGWLTVLGCSCITVGICHMLDVDVPFYVPLFAFTAIAFSFTLISIGFSE